MQLPVIPVCALGSAAALCAGCGKTPAERPNIIIIYADDVGYGDFSCNGSPTIQTPNVDRLASEGVRFTNAHTTSSTSTPARYGLLTGQYPWRKEGTVSYTHLDVYKRQAGCRHGQNGPLLR